MDQHIKFNVIIPTRERADVLVHCLRTVVAQDYKNLKIIVSDNFSQDQTKGVVDSFSDNRIQYINTGRRLSMSHNWEFALNHVVDGWVMFLGDDDGLYPWALRALDTLIQAHDVEAVSSAFGRFRWPGHFSEFLQGRLLIPMSGSAIVKNSRVELERALFGKVSYVTLPWLYHGGAASLALINRARDQSGRFFCSQIPDLYSAVALSSITGNYLFIRTPLVINGASKHSLGTASISSFSSKEDQPILKFKSEENIPFHETLIFGKSLQIMLYECYLQSWHLHEGNLGISLQDQLQAAIKTAPLVNLPAIRDECHRIADKNGIYFSDRARWRQDVRPLLSVVKREWLNFEVNPEQLDIVNIYDATVASAYLHKYIRQSGFRYFLLGANFVGRVIFEIRRTIDAILREKKVT